MTRLSRRLFPWLVLTLTLSMGLLGACRTTVAPGSSMSTPTRLAVVTAAAPAGPPAPTKTVPTRPAATATATATPANRPPTYGPVAWTLTILHTGEVYGDVLPCG